MKNQRALIATPKTYPYLFRQLKTCRLANTSPPALQIQALAVARPDGPNH